LRLRTDAASLDKNSEKKLQISCRFHPASASLVPHQPDADFFACHRHQSKRFSFLFDAAMQQSHTSACKCRRRLAFNQPNSSLKFFSAGFSLILTQLISAANSSRSRRQK
jgi:hypothetical protein